jgi:hypothetical protein
MDCLTGHLEHHVYDFGGLVLTACILCAFGFAVPTGLLRRSLPAMVAAFIPWLAIRIVIEFLFRPHFMTLLTATANCTHGCGYGIQASAPAACCQPPALSPPASSPHAAPPPSPLASPRPYAAAD